MHVRGFIPMRPDHIWQGVSVFYGVAVCHGCGAEEAFDGKMVKLDDHWKPQYKVMGPEWDRYVIWHGEHVKHRDPDAPSEDQ